MGVSSSAPLKCTLCNTQAEDAVTLKCDHHFCQPCLGDLWSVTPTGPYRCPAWRCRTVYDVLPLNHNFMRQPARGRIAAGTSSNNEQTKFDSLLRRPSLASRLLGKRKASTHVAEQPDAKRSTVGAPSEQTADIEVPSTFFSSPFPDEAGQSSSAETSKKAEQSESTQSECDDEPSPCDNSNNTAVPPSDALHDTSTWQEEKEEGVSFDDSDSSNEVDICDAPPLATPKKDTEVTEMNASLQKPASPSSSASSPGVSIPERVSKSPPMSTKHPGSKSQVGIFPRSESKPASPVPCHYCPKTTCQSAVKTCLVCGASMCSEHLRPHLDSPVFQNHTLVAPMEDISTWRCQEHQEINRIYCRECELCVCTVCTVIGSHRGHVCISIREAEREFRGKLREEIKLLQEAEVRVTNRATELTQKKDAFRGVLSEAQTGVQQQYAAIREALEQEEQSALQCVRKEEEKVLGGLEEKLGLLRSSLLAIQQGLHILEGLADAKGDSRIQDQAFIMEYSKTAQLTSDMGTSLDQFESPEEVDEARLKCLRRWTEKRLDSFIISVPGTDRDLYRLLYGSIPSLNADTAHPKLLLSQNNREVTYSEVQQAYGEHEARFSSFPQVLASHALEAGRWYWEVSVTVDEGRWKVGLCEAQIERKGQKDSSRLGFNSYSWCLACDRRKVEALHNKAADPVDADGLRRIGVFLDFDEGILSFFKVTPGGSLALLHSYKHRFTDPLYPALSVSKTHLTICNLFQT